jgi:hypothetical protein
LVWGGVVEASGFTVDEAGPAESSPDDQPFPWQVNCRYSHPVACRLGMMSLMTALPPVSASMWAGIVLSLAVTGCGAAGKVQDSPGAPSSLSAPISPGAESVSPGTGAVDAGLPAATAAFKAHFTDAIYEDQSRDFTPFGSDQGWDMLQEWAGRRNELTTQSTVAQVLEGSGFGGIDHDLTAADAQAVPQPGGQVEAAAVIIGAGFTLLRLTGHIDQAGKALTLKAIDALIDRYGSLPQLARAHTDLQSWHD